MQKRHTHGRAIVAVLLVLPVAVRRAVVVRLVATARHAVAAAGRAVGALTALRVDVVGPIARVGPHRLQERLTRLLALQQLLRLLMKSKMMNISHFRNQKSRPLRVDMTESVTQIHVLFHVLPLSIEFFPISEQNLMLTWPSLVLSPGGLLWLPDALLKSGWLPPCGMYLLQPPEQLMPSQLCALTL